ncbi:MAG TPA: DUF5679 domain-containing protein [Candidatus Limnocylindrales bacterium]
MGKHSKSRASNEGSVRRAKRKVRRLERRLAAVRELEAKRRRQAAKAREGGAPRDLVAKRERQLDKAEHRGATIQAEIASLEGAAPAAVSAASTDIVEGPRGYCLREKRTVTIANPEPMVMRNGRTGTSGTCPSCGARIVRP